MANYLPRFLIRLLFFIGVSCLLVIILASVLINIYLSTSKGKIEETLASSFNQKLSLESLRFFPPNFIILKNLSIAQISPQGVTQPLFVDRVECTFSLAKLLTDRDFVVKGIYFSKPELGVFAPPFISKEVIDKFMGIVKSLAKEQPLKIGVKKARFVLSKQERSCNYITLDANVVVDPTGLLRGFGSLGFSGSFNGNVKNDGQCFEILLLRYDFRGTLEEEKLAIDNLELKRGGFYSKLWGSLEKNVLRLNGFSSLHNVAGLSKSFKSSADTVNRLKKILRYQLKEDLPSVDLSVYDLNVYDMDCVIEFFSHAIKIADLEFSANNIPFCLKADFSFLDEPSLSLTFSSFPQQSPQARKKNPKRIDLRIVAKSEKGKFNGGFNLDFIRKIKDKKSLDKARTTFENLSFQRIGNKRIKMLFEKASLLYVAKDNVYDIIIKDFTSLFNLEDKRFKFVTFSSKIYDGFLNGEGLIDIFQVPPRNSFHLSISDVNANRLSALLAYFSKVYGRFSSEIDYKNYPYSKLNGKLLIERGLLDNLVFFNWLADFFGRDSLRKIDFDTISAYFEINDKFSGLERIRLDSPIGITLGGYFTLYHDDLVSSKLSLAVPYSFLRDSPRFKSLLQYLDKDISSLSFDFQLSGVLEAMNFKWLESDFKTGLKKLLPSWMESGIERKIENIIESISAKQKTQGNR